MATARERLPLLVEDEPARALAIIRRLLRSKTRAWLLLLWAELHRQAGELQLCGWLIRQAELRSNREDRPAVLRQLGLLKIDEGDLKAALGASARAISTATALGDATEVARSQVSLGVALYHSGDYRGALGSYRSAARNLGPGSRHHFAALLNQGLIFAEQGRRAEALEVLEAAQAGAPTASRKSRAYMWVTLARVSECAERAISFQRRAVKMFSGCVLHEAAATAELVALLARAGRTEEGAAMARAMTAFLPAIERQSAFAAGVLGELIRAGLTCTVSEPMAVETVRAVEEVIRRVQPGRRRALRVLRS